MEKRLAAVLISDVVEYTKLMEEDTEGTVKAWSEARDNTIEPTIEERKEMLFIQIVYKMIMTKRLISFKITTPQMIRS